MQTKYLFTGLFIFLIFSLQAQETSFNGLYNVKNYGASGNGSQVETEFINAAINDAAENGGGTVYFPAGKYLCFSIRLKSNIQLHIGQGATIIAANMDDVEGEYDAPEPNIWGDSLKYQDFGHSHFHNSLIWGENLENISIVGPGLIWGKGLQKWGNPKPGLGNKSISLKLCRNVILRDFSILHGGHFGILATGVDNLTIDNLKIDTNRDAIDVDCCRHVRISNCSLNTPNDDALVLKSSFALGYAAPTENITITNCAVFGFDEGTFLDGTYQQTQKQAPDRGSVTGRIKFGTESNGAFRNITISNCTFEHCRGLALETVDGAVLEDITVSNIVMKDILNAPFFLRLGRRMRGPDELEVGTFRRILVDNVIVHSSSPRYGSMLMGIPGHDIEDVVFSNIWIRIDGGAPESQALIEVPELEDGYPDPRNFGEIPAYGFFIRHVQNIQMNNITLEFENTDMRPVFILDDVKGADFQNVKAESAEGVPVFRLKNVTDFSIHSVNKIKDQHFTKVKDLAL
ncbi:glycoside hydrolase family 28 protein [Maribellus comscasis]|uniref:Glycoside hydrolase family 28 protein n=1 Tax=Maribellus comscasis TaxID=2681766 RepID=A0A6I6K1S8_9BACT|nr:glycosyl hydrolase family 28-related protein [Maribellus comscasis]QGY47418.1 glycoside hydrolase family 28 protein [Maribellus comscasis]